MSDIQPVLHKPKTPHNLKKDQKVHIISTTTTPSHRQYLGEVTSNVLDCSITPFLSLSLTMITHLILSLFAALFEKCHKPCHWGISDLLSSPPDALTIVRYCHNCSPVSSQLCHLHFLSSGSQLSSDALSSLNYYGWLASPVSPDSQILVFKTVFVQFAPKILWIWRSFGHQS